MSEERPETRGLRAAIRGDLLIATCALLISGVATAASLWQSHVVAQQLGAQVWPYVAFSETYGDQRVQLSAENDGLGPAVMRSVVVRVDGKPKRSLIDVLRALIPHRGKPQHIHAGVDMTSAAAGSVLRAGASVAFLTVSGGGSLPREIGPQLKRLTLSACYCSIEGDCWVVDESRADPARVASCPPEPDNLLTGSSFVPPSQL